MKRLTLFKSAVLLLGTGFWLAGEPVFAQLTVGDAAPKLQVGQWIQGEPVTAFDTNHVYIVEFWATWCGPCRQSIPHLNELIGKFKGKNVVAIGVDIWDADDSVAPFVKKLGDQMTYRVALDDKSADPDGFMTTHWLKRGQGNGIPTAFVINQQGVIAWIGHPMSLNEELLDQIISGQYDIAKAAAEYKKIAEENRIYQEKNKKLMDAVNAKQWDAAQPLLEDILKDSPNLQNSYAWLRLKILLGQKKYDEAYAFAAAFSDAHVADSYRQNMFAWLMVAQAGVEQRNLKLAEKLAERANTAANGKEAGILDTLARVQFMSGKTNEAVVTEQKAVAVAADGDEQANCKKTLAAYQQGQLPEVSE